MKLCGCKRRQSRSSESYEIPKGKARITLTLRLRIILCAGEHEDEPSHSLAITTARLVLYLRSSLLYLHCCLGGILACL